ncbi:MAG: hypothetical protein OM95_07620 [Bdellovibrio sp. ArHS]|uniref:hypothetical protein n=1 Tax=Bdellovibrio sp. ArHS TaxID=1569284 RepID=UPI000583BE76|nr:hypothetical protein [Bdellovibrio sp. ArHS]KHD88665.1 MAG: hypothetical protein OM95_07620 [Bdellovibrio sp. ArHS]
MRIKIFILTAALMPTFSFAQTTAVNPANADAIFQSMQTQQQFMLQQQAAQAQAAANQAVQAQQAQAEAVQKQSIFQLLMGFCTNMFSGGGKQTALGSDTKKVEDTSYDVMDAAWAAREKEGFIYERDLDRNVAREVGGDVVAKLAKGCDNFINKEGQLGPWGSYTLQQIKEKPDSFGENIPDDITKWCPNYPKMSKDQRELYWVWIIMSMASSESSCNPRNDNANAPNGTAIGLLQVWKPVCPKARDLHIPYQNIQCGIDLLAKELQNRDTLMTPTSRGPEGTYWGPLRSDDWNKRRGGDISGAQKTRAIMSQYRYCK